MHRIRAPGYSAYDPLCCFRLSCHLCLLMVPLPSVLAHGPPAHLCLLMVPLPQVVPPSLHPTAFALNMALQQLGAALGAPGVGLLALHLYGFAPQASVLSGAGDAGLLAALALAVSAPTAGAPWVSQSTGVWTVPVAAVGPSLASAPAAPGSPWVHPQGHRHTQRLLKAELPDPGWHTGNSFHTAASGDILGSRVHLFHVGKLVGEPQRKGRALASQWLHWGTHPETPSSGVPRRLLSEAEPRGMSMSRAAHTRAHRSGPGFWELGPHWVPRRVALGGGAQGGGHHGGRSHDRKEQDGRQLVDQGAVAEASVQAEALGKGMFLALALPYSLCAILLALCFWSVEGDRRRSRVHAWMEHSRTGLGLPESPLPSPSEGSTGVPGASLWHSLEALMVDLFWRRHRRGAGWTSEGPQGSGWGVQMAPLGSGWDQGWYGGGAGPGYARASRYLPVIQEGDEDEDGGG